MRGCSWLTVARTGRKCFMGCRNEGDKRAYFRTVAPWRPAGGAGSVIHLCPILPRRPTKLSHLPLPGLVLPRILLGPRVAFRRRHGRGRRGGGGGVGWRRQAATSSKSNTHGTLRVPENVISRWCFCLFCGSNHMKSSTSHMSTGYTVKCSSKSRLGSTNNVALPGIIW